MSFDELRSKLRTLETTILNTTKHQKLLAELDEVKEALKKCDEDIKIFKRHTLDQIERQRMDTNTETTVLLESPFAIYVNTK